MKMNKNLGMILLSLWLIAHAVISFFQLAWSGLNTIMPVFALVTGLVILFYDKSSA